MPDLAYLNRETLRDEALYFFKQDFPDIAPNDPRFSDHFGAYRHAYGSAVLSREFGSLVANTLGQVNEFDFFGFRDNPFAEKNQDLWNNAVGREIGSDNPSGRTVADRVKAAIQNGDLIIDENTDQRIYGKDVIPVSIRRKSASATIANTIIIGESASDTFFLTSISGFDYIVSEASDGKIAIGGIALSGNALPKTDSNDDKIEGAWNLSGFDLHIEGSNLVIVKSGADVSEDAVDKLTVINFPFSNERGAFGITLGKAQLMDSSGPVMDRLDKVLDKEIRGGGYAKQYPNNEFFAITKSSPSRNIFDISTFDERINELARVDIFETFKKNIDPSLLDPDMNPFNKIGIITHRPDNEKQFLLSCVGINNGAYVVGAALLDGNGHIKETHIYNNNMRGYDASPIVSFEKNVNNGNLYITYINTLNRYKTLQQIGNKNLAKIGDPTTYSPTQWSQISHDYENANQDSSNKNNIELRSGSRISIDSDRVSIASYIARLRDLTPEEIVPNYEITGNQQTNPNLKESIITLNREDESNLLILPNPDSYTLVMGFDNNEKAKLDILDSASEAKFYSISLKDYSAEDLLAGKFKPSSQPLSLANYMVDNLSVEEENIILSENIHQNLINAIWERKLSSNDTSELDDDQYYYGDDDILEDDISASEETKFDVATMMILPNNQTIALIGVNTTELIKNPQNYFLAQTIVGLPTAQPSTQPSNQPISDPTSQPSNDPSNQPISDPTFQPVSDPTSQPSNDPSNQPISNPSSQPSIQPSNDPTSQLTSHPTAGDLIMPSSNPTSQPFANPSAIPSYQPQAIPSFKPTNKIEETKNPTSQPSSERPTANLRTNNPTAIPSFLATQSLTQTQTFNSTFNQSLPRPPETTTKNPSFIQAPEGIVTVTAVATLAVAGLAWIFRRGNKKVEPEINVELEDQFEPKVRIKPQNANQLADLNNLLSK